MLSWCVPRFRLLKLKTEAEEREKTHMGSSREGCTDNAKRGGRHGAKVKQCSNEGRMNHVKSGRKMQTLGAYWYWCISQVMQREGCTKVVERRGALEAWNKDRAKHAAVKDVLRTKRGLFVADLTRLLLVYYLHGLLSNIKCIWLSSQDCLNPTTLLPVVVIWFFHLE